MTQTIDSLTTENLGDGATEYDLEAFKTACWRWLEEHESDAPHDIDEAAAIDAIWNNGDFVATVRAYVPDYQ